MAVSSAAGSTSLPITPTLENNFNLRIHADCDEQSRVVWKNPHWNSVITPYIPSKGDKALLESCQEAFGKLNLSERFAPEAFFITNDVSVIIVSLVDPKTLATCSRVSKCFHWIITKTPVFWENHFSILLPNVKPLGPKICTFSTQQQFQIICKKIGDLRKPYKARLDYIKERTLAIKAEITQLEAELVGIGGMPAVAAAGERFREIVAERQLQNDGFAQAQLREELKGTDEFLAFFLIDQIAKLRLEIGRFENANYSGPVESIQINIYLDQLSNAIEVLIPATITQEKYDEAIQQSETLKNNTSSNDGPVVEDVTDGAN